MAKWQVYHQQKQLTIHHQINPKTGLLEINAEVEITASIDDFYHLLTNEELAPTWLDKVNSTKLLITLDDNSFVVRTTFKGFTIVSAREMLTKSVLEVKTANRLILTVTDYNNFLPVNDDFVRVEYVNVQWKAQKLDDKVLKVTYFGSIDPGGSLPKWISNRYALSSMKASLMMLQKLKPVKNIK